VPWHPSLDSAAARTQNIPADLRFSIVDAPADAAYPITTITWLLAYKSEPEQAKAVALARLLWWATHEGQQFDQDLGYTVPGALGETVAVTMVVGNSFTRIQPWLFTLGDTLVMLSARYEDPSQLASPLDPVGHRAEDAGGQHRVEAAVRERQRLRVCLTQIDLQAQPGCACTGREIDGGDLQTWRVVRDVDPSPDPHLQHPRSTHRAPHRRSGRRQPPLGPARVIRS
jgi:hypothetical protein